MYQYLYLIVASVISFSALSMPLSVTDFVGNTISLEAPAKRIIALAPHNVENVYSAGAGEQLVAVVSHSDYPEEAKQLPIVGTYNAFSYEAILALKPDLVIAWASGNGAEAIKTLKSLGLTVYVDELDTLSDVARAIRDIGVLTGNKQAASKVAFSYLRKLERLKQQYSQQTKVSVLYQVWNTPLQTLNGEHIISDVINLCGGVNVFADAKALAPKISVESVFARNPDAIIASGMGDSRPEWLDEWLQWPLLSAVSKQQLYFIPPDIIQRHTERILQGTELMCRHLQTVRDNRNDKN